MNILSGGTILFLEGILLVVVILALKVWREDAGRPLKAWQWGLVVFWLFFFGLGCAFVGTSLGEGEPVAAMKGGLFLGFISLLTGVAIWRFALQGQGDRGVEKTEAPLKPE